MKKIGRATIHLTDCMEFMKGCEDNQFDLAIVDPPYGIGKKNTLDRISRYGQTTTVNDIGIDKLFFSELFRVSKNQIIWGGNYFTLPATRGFIFWYKHQPVKTYADGEYAWTSFDRNALCFDYPYFGSHNRDISRIHPTQKPVVLYEWLLDNYAKPGDTILDTHMGSGSIAIATNKHGFDLTACELDPEYYNGACERIEQALQQVDCFTPEIPKPEQTELL